jgi:hypothetical protein
VLAGCPRLPSLSEQTLMRNSDNASIAHQALERSGGLHILRDHIRKISLDSQVERQKPVDQPLISINVVRDDLEDVVDSTTCRIARDDRRLLENRGLEALEIGLLVAFEHDLHQNRGLAHELVRVDAGCVASDHPAPLKAAETLPTCRRGQIDRFGETKLGHPAVALESRENFQVDFVEFHGYPRVPAQCNDYPITIT